MVEKGRRAQTLQEEHQRGSLHLQRSNSLQSPVLCLQVNLLLFNEMITIEYCFINIFLYLTQCCILCLQRLK